MVQNVEPQEALFVPVQGGTNTLPWRYLAASEHQAALLNAVGQVTRQLTIGSQFTISPEGDTPAGTGEITLLVAPTSEETQLRVRGDAAAVQPVPPEPGTAAIVGALDRLAIVVQQVQAGIKRVDVPAEIEESQTNAAAAAASAQEAEDFAQAAAESALLAASFDPANFQPIADNLTELSALTFTPAGLALLSVAGAAALRAAAELGDAATLDLASQAGAEGGIIADELMTPLTTRQAIEALPRGTVAGPSAMNVLWQNTTGWPVMMHCSAGVASGDVVDVRIGPNSAASIFIARDAFNATVTASFYARVPPGWYLFVQGNVTRSLSPSIGVY
ncbi:hypothetical protein [Roseobacter sp.]|uniref:hypothetical protein n=1 Tax=Roseobacter sp. TaxID=1907202 RepID=UPI002965CFDA|nr:hypothetical protein [Roseobacter sp.]MDW3181780.1 hypothetical protein [Roseobacter sp.]